MSSLIIGFLNISGNHELEKDWPVHGKIEFRNVSLKYDAHLDKVLDGASFTIYPGEKVCQSPIQT